MKARRYPPIPWAEVEGLALAHGFAKAGFSPVRKVDDGLAAAYADWLAKGFHGEMGYLERNFSKRFNPSELMPGAQTIISLIAPYTPHPYASDYDGPKIASYAFLRDYHLSLKEALHSLLACLKRSYPPVKGRAFVDSAPFLDHFWAKEAGLGATGRNTMLISPEWGSYLFIASLLIDREIEGEETKKTLQNPCASCGKCVASCPTGALKKEGGIDARLCISYLTIEKKAPLSSREEQSLGQWVFGCDECLNACPQNARILRQMAKKSEEEAVANSVCSPQLDEKGRVGWQVSDLEDITPYKLTGEPIVSIGKLLRFADRLEPLPAESPLNRADSEKLRDLLRKKRGRTAKN